MDAAWLNAEGTAFPSGFPAPDFTLGGLRDLRSVLETRDGSETRPDDKLDAGA